MRGVRSLIFGALLGGALLAQEPPQPDVPPPSEEAGDRAGTGTEAPASQAPDRSGDERPERAADPAVVWPLSSASIAEHLRGIAAAHPSVAVLESIGPSRLGREILVLTLGARGEGASATRPALLIADYQGAKSAGAEAIMRLAWSLAGAFEHDEAVRELLTHTTLILAPALDPDRRANDGEAPLGSDASQGARSARETRFDGNFPSGWQPETVRPGSGRIPLSLPETQAAARFLTDLRSCALMFGFTLPAPRGTPYPGAELSEFDRSVFARCAAAPESAGAPALEPWFELGSPGGGLFDFAYQGRGIYPFAFVLPSETELASGAWTRFADEMEKAVVRSFALLPRLTLTQEGLERVASETWQLDVRVENVGLLPTASALARRRDARGDVALTLEGVTLVAVDRRDSQGGSTTSTSFELRSPLTLGTLAPGESCALRLFLEAAEGAEVRLRVAAPRAGTAALQLVLR